jgi:hypothetical protein
MARTRTEEVEHIQCTDYLARRYVVVISRTMTEKPTLGRSTWVETQRHARLTDGRHINVMDEALTTFLIVDSNLVLHREAQR